MSRGILKSLIRLLYPDNVACALCGGENSVAAHICHDCRLELESCRLIDDGISLLGGRRMFTAPFHYKGAAKAMLHGLKFSSKRYFAYNMAEYMSVAADNAGIGGDVLVPVPLHRIRQRKRGYNQSELLARELSKRMGIPCENLLEKQINSRPQSKTPAEKRAKNVEGVFCAAKGGYIQGRRVIIVDDVVTTGSTVCECMDVLERAGAASLAVISFALAGEGGENE